MTSYRNWWDVLEVDQNATERQIKKAYAVLLKKANNADDSELMLELQHAYNKAKKVYSTGVSSAVELHEYLPEENISLNPSTSEVISYPQDTLSPVNIEYQEQTAQYSYEDCEELLNKIYCNFNKRNKISEWHDLFSSFTLNEENLVDTFAVNYFNENFCLSQHVWEYMNERFLLLQNSGFNKKLLAQDKVIGDYLSYKELQNIDYCNSEQYYKLWLHAYQSFLACDYSTVLNYCNEALGIFSEEPYIYKLKLVSEYELARYEECLSTCEKFQRFDLDDSDIIRYKANIKYKQHKYRDASKLFKVLGKKEKDSPLAERGILKCLIAKKRYLSTLIRETFYKYTPDDVELDYRLASPLEKLFVLFGWQNIYKWISALRIIIIAFIVIGGMIALLSAGIIAFIIAIPLIIVGIIIYAFVSAVIETKREKRAKQNE